MRCSGRWETRIPQGDHPTPRYGFRPEKRREMKVRKLAAESAGNDSKKGNTEVGVAYSSQLETVRGIVYADSVF
jgi:hypothetical protein